MISPVASNAHACAPPALTVVAGASSGTCNGYIWHATECVVPLDSSSGQSSVVAYPSWLSSLRPQHQTERSLSIAQPKCAPNEICWTHCQRPWPSHSDDPVSEAASGRIRFASVQALNPI